MEESRMLEEKLSYKVYGIFIEVSKKYGHLYKEEIYHKACQEQFEKENISYVSKPRIDIISLDTGKKLGAYVPDFLVANKIIVELKSLKMLPKAMSDQLEQYLKASAYEIGYLVNFGRPKAQIIRRIYTNDRKPHIREPFVKYS